MNTLNPNRTVVCNDGHHDQCKATLRYQDPRDYDPDYPMFLCQCPCHGSILGALIDNHLRLVERGELHDDD